MIRQIVSRLRRSKKGQGLVEYGLLIGGVALIAAAAVSIFGHKTSDIIATVAAVLPGAHNDDNGPIQSGHLIETAPTTAAGGGGGGAAAGPIALDIQAIIANSGTDRLGTNVAGAAGTANGFNGLVTESTPD